MSKKLILAGVVGGLVSFAWGAIAHMALPLGEAGIDRLPNEDAVVAVLRDNVREAGFYFFPGMDESSWTTPEAKEAGMQAWTEKYTAGPTGVLIYHPVGRRPMSPAQLGTQALADIAGALVAAFLLAHIGAGYGRRVLCVALLGLFAEIAIGLPYWNWYGFPGDFTLASLAEQLIGWTLVGLVLARLAPRPATAA